MKTLLLLLASVSLAFAQVGNEAENFTLNKLSGGTFTLSDHLGKVVYINWLGWDCPTCKGEGNDTQTKIADNYSSDVFTAIGIDTWDGNSSQVQSFKNQTGIQYPLLLNGKSTRQAYGVNYQYSMVIDQEGIIQWYGRTSQTDNINEAISTLLNATSIEDKGLNPYSFSIKSNYPNPFNPNTTIEFSIDKTQDVKLQVYNITGQLVKTIIEGTFASGEYETAWDGSDNFGKPVASGIYFARLNGEFSSQIHRMVLVK